MASIRARAAITKWASHSDSTCFAEHGILNANGAGLRAVFEDPGITGLPQPKPRRDRGEHKGEEDREQNADIYPSEPLCEPPPYTVRQSQNGWRDGPQTDEQNASKEQHRAHQRAAVDHARAANA